MAVLAGQPARAGTAPGALAWTRVTAYWVLVYRRLWKSFVITDALAPLAYLAAMGLGLGQLVDGAHGAGAGAAGAGGVGGVPYAAFVAPGVLAAQAMQAAVGETTFPVMGAVKWNRQYHAMLAGPLRVRDVVVGHLAWVLLRVVVSALVFTAVAMAVSGVPAGGVGGALAAVPVAVLDAMAFAALVFGLSARSESDATFNLVFRFVVTPLFLFSGTFFPVSQLPAALQGLALATPLYHAVAGARSLWLGTATAPALAGHCAYLAALTALGVVLALRSLRSRMVV